MNVSNSFLLATLLLANALVASTAAAQPPAESPEEGPDAAQPSGEASEDPGGEAAPDITDPAAEEVPPPEPQEEEEELPAPSEPEQPVEAPAEVQDAAPVEGMVAPVEEPDAAEAGSSLVQEDVQPTVTLFSGDDVELRMGALMQVHAVPYAGDDALIENGDVASGPGFRLRRARLGIDADLPADFGLYLTFNMVGIDVDDGLINDAKLTWSPAAQLRLALGSGKVPFSRAALSSSRSLLLPQRPLSARLIAPENRLGLTAEGSIAGDRVSYVVGLMNGTPGFTLGNRFGGYLAGARVEVRPFGPFDPDAADDAGLAVAGGAIFEDGPGTNTLGWSADLLVAFNAARLVVEVLCDRIEPDQAPLLSPGVSDTVDRCGGYAEAAYTLPFQPGGVVLQPAVRAELVDDHRNIDDSGDALLIGGGINAAFAEGYLRSQLHYLARRERHGVGLQNDVVVLVVQGSF